MGLVDQNSVSWNQITDGLKQIEWLHSTCRVGGYVHPAARYFR